jgi:uncharacterized membrane protein
MHPVGPSRKGVAPLIAAAIAVMAIGMLLRIPTAAYHGAPNQFAFNDHLFHHMGSYSDVSSLYFREDLSRHPTPYLDYPLEYPVGIGAAVWLIGFVRSSAWAYLALTAAVLAACAVAVLLVGRAIPGANMWLLALSPVLALSFVLNWDLLGILPTVAALLLFGRDRDRFGTLALAAGVWTKFFPIILLPLVIALRLFQRRARAAVEIVVIFVVASAAVNLPIAIATRDGLHLRDGWLRFFRYSASRGREVNFWNIFDRFHFSVTAINLLSLGLIIAMLLAILLMLREAVARGPRSSGTALVWAALIAISFALFIGKVYSPQYGLWIATLLALVGAPAGLAVAFAAADVAFFVASFAIFPLEGSGAAPWFYDNVLIPSMWVREAVIAFVIAYGCRRLMSATAPRSVGAPG